MQDRRITRREAGALAAGLPIGLAAQSSSAVSTEICFLTATELVRKIRRKEISTREVLAAHLKQIERVNPKVNAIITLVADQAMEQARRADEAQARGEPLGPLHGLPVAHKDLQETKGIRTTFGSRIYKDNVPDRDSLTVERIKRAGAINVGKTNTPEFGAGSQTFNEVFGATQNPYDTGKTCGGSSGGAAVALACGMIPIADGSDLGGSLRNPAAFCNVVGFRTAPGRVPRWPAVVAWFPLSVDGPMARTVADTALLLSAIAGPDLRSPISIQESGSRFRGPLGRNFKGTRIAWAGDLGGLPFDPQIRQVVDAQRKVFEGMGCLVEQAEPDFTDVDAAFKVLRAWHSELQHGEMLRRHPELYKDTLRKEIEDGARLSGAQVSQAEVKRTRFYHRMRLFMAKYEFFVLPVTQVPPFDIDQPFVTEINGRKMESYIDWMRSCYYISMAGNPALSAPCGFTPAGLPVGIQLVGRHQDEWGVLQLAAAFEQATGIGKRRPGLALS
jgi:amidase